MSILKNRAGDLANNISLDSVIEDGGKPNSTGTSTTASETATATGETTSPSGSGTAEQENSASQSHLGYWAFSSVVMAFILL
jgi:hypothetical protein